MAAAINGALEGVEGGHGGPFGVVIERVGGGIYFWYRYSM